VNVRFFRCFVRSHEFFKADPFFFAVHIVLEAFDFAKASRASVAF
jgi:hypothetical protein